MVIPYSSLREEWSKVVIYYPKKKRLSKIKSIIKFVDKKLDQVRPIQKIKNTKIIVFESLSHINFIKLYFLICNNYLVDDIAEYYNFVLNLISYISVIEGYFYFVYRDSRYYKKWRKGPRIFNIDPNPEIRSFSYPSITEKELKLLQEHHLSVITDTKRLERQFLRNKILESKELELFEISVVKRQNPKILYLSKKIDNYKSRLKWPKRPKTLAQKKALTYARNIKYRALMKKGITKVRKFKHLLIEMAFDLGNVGAKVGKVGIDFGKVGVGSVKSLVVLPYTLYKFIFNRTIRKIDEKRLDAEKKIPKRRYKDRNDKIKIVLQKIAYLSFFRTVYFVNVAKENERQLKINEQDFTSWLKEKLNLEGSEIFYPRTKAANILGEEMVDKIAGEERNIRTDIATLMHIFRFLYPDLPVYYKYGSYALYFEDEVMKFLVVFCMKMVNENLLNEDENLLNEDENLLNEDENLLNEDENLLNEDENLLNEDENLLNEDENLLNEDENLLNEDENLLNEDENLLNEDENLLNEDENLLNEDENLLNEDEK